MFTIVDKDLLTATEDYICHQTNCVSMGAAGLAKSIFDLYPETNIYKARKQHSEPGRYVVNFTHDDKQIVHMMAQIYPGGPFSVSKFDGAKHRVHYFRTCLWHMCQELPHDSSFAFPWGIGCGIAGGNWATYIEILKDFETFINARNNKANVAIYKLPK